MRFHTGRACGKAILAGEHAVVYGRPALGVPLAQIAATAEIREGTGGATIVAEDLDAVWTLDELGDGHAIAHIVHTTLAKLGEEAPPNFLLTIRSTIPIARGLGSGTAVSTAIVRALAAHYGHTLNAAQVSALVFETEKLYHGTPSGVDNTIIAYEAPVYFVRGQPPQRLRVARPFRLVIVDTGVPSETKVAVGDVRAAWQAEPARYEAIFDAIGKLVEQARDAIEYGRLERLGPLMDANQAHLREIGVSSPELERLIAAAKGAGASGAKLSGGGRGGCMIALVDAATQAAVQAALTAAGAKAVLVSEVGR
ncbi:MAG: mevalonate kinase [Chloroflexi bacterium]|nr:mevalonate kinase [Chloroflexota bacterium]